VPDIKWRELHVAKGGSEQSGFRAEDPFLDLYEVLEVSPHASSEVIKAAYRTLIEKHHPDKHPEDRRALAEEASTRLNAAYAVLGNPQKRSKYDFDNGITGRT
jgi:curved DNA-binding protein CbpA